MIKFIECISHKLTGSAILRACGIGRDGKPMSELVDGQMPPVCLILPRGSTQDKLNTIRSTLSQMVGNHNTARMFEIKAGMPIGAFYTFGSQRVEVDYVVLNFVAGRARMRMAMAMEALSRRRETVTGIETSHTGESQ